MFASKAGAFLSEALIGAHLLGRLQNLAAKIRLG